MLEPSSVFKNPKYKTEHCGWYTKLKVYVSEDVYNDLIENGLNDTEVIYNLTGINLEKHSWHEYREDLDKEHFIIHVLIAETFSEFHEGQFVRIFVSTKSI